MVVVQAPARVRSGGDVVRVAMSTVDALAVGHSIRTLIRARKLPPGTAEIYERVAMAMIAEARTALAQGRAE